MERVQGIGGVFFRARDAQSLARWCEQHLRIPIEGGVGSVMRAEAGDVTVWSPFKDDTEYFSPSGQQLMTQLPRERPRRDARATARSRRGGRRQPAPEDENGRFGWAVDPEGNRIELWQPPAVG